MASEKEKLRESVLMNLRSVTESCKGGVPVSSLQNDYKNLIGTTIPFQSLGYSSLQAFLESIPCVIALKKNPNGQLFAAAVPNASTTHLTNLISKQKGKKIQKPSTTWRTYSTKKTSNQIPSASSSNNWNQILNEKNKIIEDLKLKLEKEKKINQDFSSQMSRLNSLVKIGQDSLVIEQETVRKLKEEKEALQESYRTDKNTDLPKAFAKEMNDLKSRLGSEKSLNKKQSSELVQLRAFIDKNLKDNQENIQKIKSKIENIRGSVMVFPNILSQPNTKLIQEIDSVSELLDALSTDAENQLKSSNTSSQENTAQFSQRNISNLYQQHCEQIEGFKIQLNKQDFQIKEVENKFETKVKQLCQVKAKLENKYDSQFNQLTCEVQKKIENKFTTQIKQLSSEVRKNRQGLIDMNNAVEMLLNHFPSQSAKERGSQVSVSSSSSNQRLMSPSTSQSDITRQLIEQVYISQEAAIVAASKKKRSKRRKRKKLNSLQTPANFY